MKKALFWAVVLCVLLVCAAAVAEKYNITTSGKFQDPAFQNYLKNLPEGADGFLTDEELAGIKKIEVDSMGITSLEGIKLFKNLEVLSCSNNSIQELDVSGLAKLKNLYCHDNKVLSLLKVSGCSELQEIEAYGNIISTLNISDCSALQKLTIFDNQLTNLDVSGRSSLKLLSAYDNRLTSLNISGCSSMEELAVSKNRLSSVDVSSCTKLKILVVSANKLSSINISKCAASLLYLDISDNSMTSVNLNGCKPLVSLWCYGNEISSLDITPAPELRNAFRNGEPVDEGTYLRYCTSDGLYYPFADGLAVDKTITILANIVSFNANGGSGTMNSLVEPNDKTFTLPANNFTHDGWKFIAWNTKEDGSGTTYTDNATIKLKNEDLSLYAQWDKGQQADSEIVEQVRLKKIKGIKLKAQKKNIAITWKKLSKKDLKKVRKIQIQVSTDPDFQNIVKTKLISSKKTAYTISGLKKNTKYYIRIRAYTKKDGVIQVSDWVIKNKKTKKN